MNNTLYISTFPFVLHQKLLVNVIGREEVMRE